MRNSKTTIALLAAYGLATFVPAPGLWLGSLGLGWKAVHLPQILLALLLLSAGICSSRDALRRVLAFRLVLMLSVMLAWFVPVLSALAIVTGLLAVGCPASVALGITIVAAMPIANSSVGWSTMLDGHVAMSIALLVCVTALSPLLTPMLVAIGAYGIGTTDKALLSTPWSEGMGLFFLVWVLVPVLAGVLIASKLSRDQSQKLAPALRLLSFGILVLLNYLNGAACLPSLARQPAWLIWPMLAAVGLFCLSYGGSQLFKWLSNRCAFLPRINPANHKSLTLAIIMRNTGAALVFAGEALPSFALVSITIVTYTLVQHLGVGLLLAPRSAASRDLVQDAELDDDADLQQQSTSRNTIMLRA